mgnify:FL=1
MKIKIKRKSLKEDGTDKEERGDPTQRTYTNKDGGKYKPPEKRYLDAGGYKLDPTMKVQNPFVDPKPVLATSDYPEGKEPRIKLPPELGGVSYLPKNPPKEVFFNDDMEEPDPYGRKSRLGESVDKDAKFQPLQEIARRHFKKG